MYSPSLMVRVLFSITQPILVKCSKHIETSQLIYTENLLFGFYTLREKCPYSEFFWSVSSHIRTEYGEILQMRGNTDQKDSKYGYFLRCDIIPALGLNELNVFYFKLFLRHRTQYNKASFYVSWQFEILRVSDKHSSFFQCFLVC